MESKPASHVSHAGRWLTGLSAPGGGANSPLAFFDLIMASAREAAQSGQYDPLPGPSSTSTESDDHSPETGQDDDRSHSSGYSQRDEYPAQYAGEMHSSSTLQEILEETNQDEAAVVHLSAEAETNLSSQDHNTLPAEEGPARVDDSSQETAQAAATGPASSGSQPGDGEATDRTVASGELNQDNSLAAAQQAGAETADSEAAASISADQQGAESKEADRDNLSSPADRLPQEEISSERDSSGVENGRERDVNEGRARGELPSDREADPASGNDRHDRRGSRRSDTSSVKNTVEALKEQSENDKAESPNLADSPDALKSNTDQATGDRRPQNGSEARTVATAVETRQAVKGLEQGGTADGSPGEGLSSLVQRGIQRGMLKPSSSGQGGAPVDTRQQVRMVNRVARAVESTPPGQPVRIRLNPPELGALRIEIRIEKGAMTARIEAETEVARQLLTENLPQLKERLSESQITVEKFEIDLLGKETAGEGEGRSHSADDREARGERDSRGGQTGERKSSGEGPPEEDGQARETILDRQSRNLNIVV